MLLAGFDIVNPSYSVCSLWNEMRAHAEGIWRSDALLLSVCSSSQNSRERKSASHTCSAYGGSNIMNQVLFSWAGAGLQ